MGEEVEGVEADPERAADENEGERRRAQCFKLPKAIGIGFGWRASRKS